MTKEEIFAILENMSNYIRLNLEPDTAEETFTISQISRFMAKVFELLADRKPDKNIIKMLSCNHQYSKNEYALKTVSQFTLVYFECEKCGEKIITTTSTKEDAIRAVKSLIAIITDNIDNNDTWKHDIIYAITFLTKYLDLLNKYSSDNCDSDYGKKRSKTRVR